MDRTTLDAEVEQLEKELEEAMGLSQETSEESTGEGSEETQDMDTSEETETDEGASAETEEETQDEEIQGDASETEEDTSEETTDTEDTSTDWERRYKEVQSFATKVAQQNTLLMEQLQGAAKPDSKEETSEKKEQAVDYREKLAAEYPELAELLFPALKSIVEETIKPVQEVAQELTQDNLSRTQREFNEELMKAVPNVMDVIQTDDFASWLRADTMLPAVVKAQMFTSSSPKDATSLMGQYQLEKRIRDDKVKQAKANKNKNTAAKNTADVESGSKNKNSRTFAKAKTSEGPSFTQNEIDNMALEEFEKHEPEIMEALSKGLIF